jgi:hypothetical protein
MGLSFFCVTDHSYDLDDRIDDYLTNDPQLPQWRALQTTVEELNRRNNGFVVLRGEEVSCRNAKGENVHLLLYGNHEFVPGSGDSAEVWLQTRSALSIGEILSSLNKRCVAAAAHPRERVPRLQRLLLGRGSWSEEDFQHDTLRGIQFANGSWDAGFTEGYHLWIRLLLQGKRLYAYGGNDAHGNFNRFRQVKIPFVSLQEKDQQLFGFIRTGVFLDRAISEAAVLDALQAGRCIVTDGPVLNLQLASDTAGTRIGSTISFEQAVHIQVVARSSVDYGAIGLLRVLRGTIGAAEEELLWEFKGEANRFEVRHTVEIRAKREFYLRAEVWTRRETSFDGNVHVALTNPVWCTCRQP